jgi:hypothetical protein
VSGRKPFEAFPAYFDLWFYSLLKLGLNIIITIFPLIRTHPTMSNSLWKSSKFLAVRNNFALSLIEQQV